jgi:putative phosphonate catabolism associated alcohol dehydrogenase
MNSRAAVLAAFHQPLELRTYPLPPALPAGAALVRVEMAGICGTDVHLWLGQLPIPVPVILGHETAGRIAALGEGLERDWRGEPLAIGDRVVWASSIVCGQCYYCRLKRQPTRCLARRAYGISYCCDEPPHLHGGYAEHIVLRPGTSIFKLPDALTPESVVGAGCALWTVIHGLERMPLGWGEVVVVQGAGPVGLAAVAAARGAGASRIIVVGGPAHRLDRARSFGADATIDIDAVPIRDRKDAVLAATPGGFGADAVMECAGQPAAVAEGLEYARDGGKMLVLGQYGDAGPTPLNPHLITRKQLQLHGSWGFEPRHVHAALEFLTLTRERFPFATSVTHRFGLEQANEALQTTREWKAGKAVIVP